MSIVNILKTKAIIMEIKKQNPERLAIKLADLLDNILDDSCGNKRSYEIQKVVIPWFNRFSIALAKRLNKSISYTETNQKKRRK